MTDRGPTVINRGRSNTTIWVAVILALVVIGGLLMFTGVFNGGGGTDVNVNVPAVETPSTDKPATDTPAKTDTPATTETPATTGTPTTDTPATGTGTPATGTNTTP